jgi:hypothetical protein
MPRDPADLREFAAEMAVHMREVHPQGLTAVLAIPSSWCFARELDLPEGRWSEAAACFALEEHLPVDLERLTCASQKLRPGGGVVVAAFTEALAGLLDEFAKQAIEIESVTPCLPQTCGPAAKGLVLLEDSDHCAYRSPGGEGSPALQRSFVLNGSTSALRHQARLMLSTAPVGRFDSASFFQPSMDPGADSSSNERDGSVSGIRTLLDRLVADSIALDLRTGELAYAGRFRAMHCRLQGVLIAGLALACVFALKLRVENMRYAAAIEDLRPVAAQLYESALGGPAPATGAALRLRSERIKLEGLTHSGVDRDELVPGSAGAVRALQWLSSEIPSGVKLDVSEIAIDSEGLRVTGCTTTHEAAGDLVAALNESGKFEVDPPRTKLKSDKTVEFRISAKRKSNADER